MRSELGNDQCVNDGFAASGIRLGRSSIYF
jgi:hypothetical protein